jgi:TonB family protein
MGNPASFDSNRRYARPGEIDTPILELTAEPRLPVAPIPNRTSPTPVPNRQSTAPAPDHVVPTAVPNRTNATPVHNRQSAAPAPDHRIPTAMPTRTNPIPPAGKDAISKINAINMMNKVNRQKVSARFELLPDRKPQWGRIGVSAATQLTALGLLLLAPLIFPQPMQTALKFDVVELMQPVTQIAIPSRTPPPPPKVKPKVRPPEPKQVVPEPVVLNPKQPHVFVITKPELPKVHTLEVKPLELNPNLKETKVVVVTSQPAPPKEEVKVGLLSPGSPAPATVIAPANKVQTGGFGDPNGIHGPGNPSRSANINQAGSPLLPGGPGYGNGSSGAQGIRGTVAADGSRNTAVTRAGATTGVEILGKTNPAYSDEGRTLRIEGDVVLEVVFLASGQVQVIRVVSGLGHGLDDAAVQAAKQIRFRPAKREGQPVDFPAHVRIAFRLAK